MRTLRPMRCFAGPHGFVYILRRASSLSKTPRFGGGEVAHAGGGYDSQIRTRPRFFYNASTPSPKVSSSYVYSFVSYRVDTYKSHKPTNKQTDSGENIQPSSLRYDVG